MVKNIRKSIFKTCTIALQPKKTLWVILILTSILCVTLIFGVEGDYTDVHWDTGLMADPHGITTNGTYLFVCAESSSVVVGFYMNGTPANFNWTLNASQVKCYGLDFDGTYYRSVDQSSKKVYVYDEGHNYVTTFPIPTGMMGVTANDTNVWVTDVSKTHRYKRTGGGTVLYLDNFTNDRTINMVDVYGDYLYFVGYVDGTDKVYKHHLNGTYVSNFTATSPNEHTFGIETDGNYFWLSDAVDKEVYVYDGPGKTADFQVTLSSPVSNTAFSDVGAVFIVDYAVIDYSLKNATYNIWFSNGTLFNQTTYSINASNVTKQYFEGFTLNNYIWNVKACVENATATLCEWADSNYTFIVGAAVTSIFYNNQTYETASETFTASFNILNESEISLAQLVYDGINHTISDITTTSSTFNISETIDISLNTNAFTNELKDFFFRFVYAGNQIQETETYYQNISFINLQLCNATYNTTALNFTYYDEITNTEIEASTNATSIQTTFKYWLGSGNVYRNYSYNNLTNNATAGSQYKFCIYPAWQTFKTDMDLEYEAEDYSPRTHYFRNASLTNQTREIDLNLLTIEDSVKFFIDVKQGMTPFTNAIVTISKYFTGEGVYRTISIRETDEVGEFIEYLDLDKKYRYSVVKEGISYGSIIKQASCEEAPCEISLQLEEAAVDVWQGYYDVFATNVAYTLFYDDTSKIVTYTFNDLTGLAQYFRLLVTQTAYNRTGATICDKILYSTAGTLTCNMTGYDGDFRATGYIHKSPGKVVGFILFIISTIKDTLGATGILISLFIIITVALVGAWNPAVGVILVAFSVLMMKILGFVAFGYTTVILIFIIAAILAIKMKT